MINKRKIELAVWFTIYGWRRLFVLDYYRVIFGYSPQTSIGMAIRSMLGLQSDLETVTLIEETKLHDQFVN